MSFGNNVSAEEQDCLSSEKENLPSEFFVDFRDKNEENSLNSENNNSFNETENNENSFMESEGEKKVCIIHNKMTESKIKEAIKNEFPFSFKCKNNEEEDKDINEDEIYFIGKTQMTLFPEIHNSDCAVTLSSKSETNIEKDIPTETKKKVYTQPLPQDQINSENTSKIDFESKQFSSKQSLSQPQENNGNKDKLDSKKEKLLPPNIKDNNSQLFDESNNKEISNKFLRKPKTKIISSKAKQGRKNDKDTMRKNYKTNLLKELIKRFNEKLIEIYSKKLKPNELKELKKRINKKIKKFLSKTLGFKFPQFPQSIVTNMSIEINKKILEKTFKDVLSDTDFMIESFKTMKKKKKKDNNPESELKKLSKEKKIMEKNRKILNELNSNGNGELNIFLNKKMKDIHEEFINSEQFQRLIKKLSVKGNYYFYIHNYIEIAKDYVNHYNKEEVNENEKDKDVSEEDDGYESD